METEAPAEESTVLQQLRNMWQFANLAQYLFLFKGALKIDEDFDIEVRVCAHCTCLSCGSCFAHCVLTELQELETECLLPQPSTQLAAIGLALLKHVSSHKGLTYDTTLPSVLTDVDEMAGLKYLMNIHGASLWRKPRHVTLSAPKRHQIALTALMSSPR